tara:strand:- start:6921 stop:8024 length:1104 start_codon:yes stop_codon:yes gene_type:complete
MPLFTGTQQQYYDNSQSFTATANQTVFTLTFDPLPAIETEFIVFVNGNQINSNTYSYAGNTGGTAGQLTLPAQAAGNIVLVRQITENELLGNYQYIGLNELVNNFIISYVGEEKLITKVKRADVIFHASRGIAELSYDTLRSHKSQEIELPPSLKMKLPHDYVNYVKICYADNNGVERLLYPSRKTSNPTALLQSDDYEYLFNEDGTLLNAFESDTWVNYQSSDRALTDPQYTSADDYDDDKLIFEGKRYGLDPEFAQANGIFYIDKNKGFIHFSSNMVGKIITLKYISDSLGTEDEKLVHKFAEEAIYKHIAHAIIATRANMPEYLVQRFKRERYAAIRNAKLRLSNFKSEEIAQVMRGKSKQIKH